MKLTDTREGIVLEMEGTAGGDPRGIIGLVAIATGRTIALLVAIAHILIVNSVIVMPLASHL